MDWLSLEPIEPSIFFVFLSELSFSVSFLFSVDILTSELDVYDVYYLELSLPSIVRVVFVPEGPSMIEVYFRKVSFILFQWKYYSAPGSLEGCDFYLSKEAAATALLLL